MKMSIWKGQSRDRRAAITVNNFPNCDSIPPLYAAAKGNTVNLENTECLRVPVRLCVRESVFTEMFTI